MNHDEKLGLLKQIGGRVRALRSERSWTRQALAGRAGLSPRFLAQLEAGEGNISIVRLAAVADALHRPLRDLMPGDNSSANARGKREHDDRPIIALIGLRGAGKSSAGAKLAKKLKVPFVELDSLIERAASMRLSQIFSIHGEKYYRRLEYEALKELLARPKPMVLATGGSIVTDARTWNLVKQHCKTVWLKATPEVYWTRLLKQGDTRPMKDNPSAMAELRALLADREPLYAQADRVIDTSRRSIPQVTHIILQGTGDTGAPVR